MHIRPLSTGHESSEIDIWFNQNTQEQVSGPAGEILMDIPTHLPSGTFRYGNNIILTLQNILFW